jgi:SAM-dependent methyltransferase
MPQAPTHARPDRYVLYEAAVQNVEHDLDFFERTYRALRGGAFTRLREDFCGTAALASAWVVRDPRHRAWAVDRDAAPLRWARRHRLPRMRAAARRLVIEQHDVRRPGSARVDVVAALNFSFWVFREREELAGYLRSVRRSLRKGGLFFAQLFGGARAMGPSLERRHMGASTSVDGAPVPPFTYFWQQASFDPVEHRLRCYIHFRLRGGRELRRAFRYDWRLWTLPEVRELLLESGFTRAEVYVAGGAGGRAAYRRAKEIKNPASWLAYVVGVA